MYFCFHSLHCSVTEQCRSRPWRARTFQTPYIAYLWITWYQYLGDIEQFSISLNSEFFDTSKFSVCFGSRCMAAFIDDIINHPHILVFWADTAKSGGVCPPAILLCKFSRTFIMRSVFAIFMLQNSALVSGVCVPRKGFPLLVMEHSCSRPGGSEFCLFLLPRHGFSLLEVEHYCSRPGSSELSLLRVSRSAFPKLEFHSECSEPILLVIPLWPLFRVQSDFHLHLPRNVFPKLEDSWSVPSLFGNLGSRVFWEFCVPTDRLWEVCLPLDRFWCDTGFIALDVAFTVESSERPSWDLFDITTLHFLFDRQKWLRESRKIHDDEKMQKIVPFVTRETTFGQHVCHLAFESTYLIWILGSKLNLSNNQSNATRCVRDTCLIVWFLFWWLSSKMYKGIHLKKSARSQDPDLCSTSQHVQCNYLLGFWFCFWFRSSFPWAGGNWTQYVNYHIPQIESG